MDTRNQYTSLRELCADPDTLFAIPQDDFLRLVYQEFPADIDRLIRAYSIRDEWCPPDSLSPSYIIFKENYDEVNRTLVGVLSLRWIHLGQYETFVASQSPDLRLTRESFDWIRDFYAQTISNSDTLSAINFRKSLTWTREPKWSPATLLQKLVMINLKITPCRNR